MSCSHSMLGESFLTSLGPPPGERSRATWIAPHFRSDLHFAMERPAAGVESKAGIEQRPAGIGQEQPASPPAIERVGAFGERLPGDPGPAPSLRPRPEEPAPSPTSEALPQPSDSHLVSIGESTRPLVPTFCFAPLPVPLQALSLDIRYDNESRHYYVAEATLERVLERCNAKRQECESHGLLSPAHNVTLPLEAREAFRIPREAERCAAWPLPPAPHTPRTYLSSRGPRSLAGMFSRTR